MELKRHIQKIKTFAIAVRQSFASLFYKASDASTKKDINWSSLKILVIASVTLFIVIVMLLPDEQDVQFSQKSEDGPSTSGSPDPHSQGKQANRTANSLWAAPDNHVQGSGASQANYNTAMVLGSDQANARTQLRPGIRLPVRILDKFIVSDSPVPVLAEVVIDVTSESGLKIPAGTKIYGEASFQKGQDRAQIRFTQLSLASGEIRPAAGTALSKDGQPGLAGHVYSDSTKNTAGSVLTTFIAGFASGSMETDVFGSSKGGIQNGILSAVAGTAKDRAQSYGEKLKAEREWIEVVQGTECDVVLNESLNLQTGGSGK